MLKEKPKPQSGNMSVEEMLMKIMEDQAQLAAAVGNNKLATKKLAKKFGQLSSFQNSRLKEVYLEIVIKSQNR